MGSLIKTAMTGMLMVAVIIGFLISEGSDPESIIRPHTERATAILVHHMPQQTDGKWTVMVNLMAPSFGEDGKHLTLQVSYPTWKHWKDGDVILVNAVFEGHYLTGVELPPSNGEYDNEQRGR